MLNVANSVALERRLTKEVTATSATLKPGRKYVANNGSLVTLTLPSTSKVGDTIVITGKGAGGWKIGQLAGQQIRHISSDTTAGTGGSLASASARDTVVIECTTENTTWTVRNNKGTLTVV